MLGLVLLGHARREGHEGHRAVGSADHAGGEATVVAAALGAESLSEGGVRPARERGHGWKTLAFRGEKRGPDLTRERRGLFCWVFAAAGRGRTPPAEGQSETSEG